MIFRIRSLVTRSDQLIHHCKLPLLVPQAGRRIRGQVEPAFIDERRASLGSIPVIWTLYFVRAIARMTCFRFSITIYVSNQTLGSVCPRKEYPVAETIAASLSRGLSIRSCV